MAWAAQLWLLLVIAVAPAAAHPVSAVTSVEIGENIPAGVFGGIAFRRLRGEIHGQVSPEEGVAGISAHMRASALRYSAAFELLVPQRAANADGIIVEAANRGMGALSTLAALPARDAGVANPAAQRADGERFLLGQHLSLALIQWQVGIASGVPPDAQGVGEVIVRDFGRWLSGRFRDGSTPIPVFHRLILAGVSQSAWLVNSVVAEGFNVDPANGRGVYQGVFTRNGVGVVLAINRFAAGGAQFPYVPPDLAPLMPSELLRRPRSDPVLVDLAALTDFYRLRAGLFARAPGPARLHRFATMAAHAPGTNAPLAQLFGAMGCNGGQPVALNAVSDATAVRALLLGLADAIGIRTATRHRLPPDAPFMLAPAPAKLAGINRLGSAPLWIPAADVDGVPLGGIGLIEATAPVGRPAPPALSPVGVRSINDVCGNFSGWEPWSTAEIGARYGSRQTYRSLVARRADHLIRTGYLLASDRTAELDRVERALPPDVR